jgi:ABC-2 type transport system permease protein
MTTLGMVLLIFAGKLVYHMQFNGNALSVLAGFTLSSLSFFAIGFVLAGLMPTARTAQVVGMVILYPMLFLSGAGFPRELLPEAIKKISAFLPLTYVVNLLRGLWTGEAWSGHVTEVVVLAAILVMCIVISVKTFRWE